MAARGQRAQARGQRVKRGQAEGWAVVTPLLSIFN